MLFRSGEKRLGDMYNLYDKNGEMFHQLGAVVYTSSYAFAEFDPSYVGMIRLVLEQNVMVRGNIGVLLLALLLIVLTVIDIKYPLAFFTMKHFLDVQNPEPSDFYITMQEISWVVVPIIALIVMIVALFIR